MRVAGTRSGWRSAAGCWAVMALLLGAQAGPEQAWADSSQAATRIVVDGNDWMESNSVQRQAFLIGVANMIVAETAYARRHGTGAPPVGSLVTEAVRDMKLDEIEQRITGWYEANPARMSMPVMGVLWKDLVGR